jgi:peptide/nickel transport system substrate-binding protein
MKKIVAILLTVIMVMGAFTGCGTNGEPPAPAENETEQPVGNEEASGDETVTKKDSLVISMASAIANLDPQGHADIYSLVPDVQIFDALIYADENGKYQLMLAESMEPSEDAMKMTVKIRQGVKFTNGDELKASDVKFSFDRGINSATFGRVPGIEGVDIIDDYTVDIRFKEPTAYMEKPIKAVYIVNEKEVAAAGEDFGHSIEGVIGTGAYKITSWEKGQSLAFTRNEDYWQGEVPIKDMTIKIIADQSTAALALEKGEIDYIFDGDPVIEKTLKNAANVQIVSAPQNSFNFITMNCSKPPFDNVDLRKAVAYAINKEDIVIIAKEGNAKPTGYFVLETMEGHVEDVFSPEQDLEKAKEYLEKAGYKDGLTVTFISYDDESARTGAVIQDELSQIGITVEIQAMEFGAYVDKLFDADYEFGIIGLMSLTDPGYIYNFIHSESGMSIFHYATPELDKLLDDGKKELDEAKRNAIYKEMQEILRDEQVFVPLYAITQYMYADKDLGGVKVFPVDVPHFRDLYWK